MTLDVIWISTSDNVQADIGSRAFDPTLLAGSLENMLSEFANSEAIDPRLRLWQAKPAHRPELLLDILVTVTDGYLGPAFDLSPAEAKSLRAEWSQLSSH